MGSLSQCLAIPPIAVETLLKALISLAECSLDASETLCADSHDYSLAERKRVKLHVACMNAAAVVVPDAKRSEP